MSMPLSLARRISSGRVTLEDLREEAERVLGAKAASRRRTAPRRKKGREEKETAKSLEAAANAEVYRAVKRRDRGCTVQLPESIMGLCSGPIQIDHQWGRGKEETRVENCRCLCEAHHRRKTDSKPSRLVWLYDFAEHALACAGLDPAYFAEVERAQNFAQLEKAQHPSPVPSSRSDEGER